MKILHTGDIHLGDLNGPVRDGKNARRQDTLRCMDYIAEVAAREKPQVTIIAGDLFNRARVWADTVLEDVNEAITRFIRPLCQSSQAVVLLFGTENHDNPRAYDTLMEVTSDEENLHIYTKPAVETIHTNDGPVQIMALPGFDRGRLRLFCPGADKETENRNATALINDVLLGLGGQVDPGKPAILVAHYTVAGAEADNGSTFLAGQDVVLTPTTIDSAHVNLACLGHIHHPQRLTCNTPAFYCGSVNQLNFNDEDCAHGFYIHELAEDGTVESRFINTPERRHYTMRMGAGQVAEFISAGTVTPPEKAKDAIVRVRYSCTAEQEKAFNRAELQKRIMEAGAFWTAEILPEDVEALDARDEITEHDGPAETLARWLEVNEITGPVAERITALALPIIKQADDGRDASRHAGAFTPIHIQVTNYRSYTEAEFAFTPIRMAMVNGSNGVGKSSLFMDAIADCLYEQSRKEDIGGWVRDGTKSGSITFEFQMGGTDYRVVRTRTKSGRGTLALHRKNKETGEWEDESDTTMRLTQAKIERLLGMDCDTFCSIALIRQDAYGLFLEADSDRRMEVLSALLGLDIYTRMEDAAKAEATEQRRAIAAVKEHINVLTDQVAEKAALAAQDAELEKDAGQKVETLRAVESSIEAGQREETMRQEIARQAKAKAEEADGFGRQARMKQAAADDAKAKLENAKRLSGALESAEKAAEAVADARAQLDQLAPKEEQYRAVKGEDARISGEDEEAARTVKRLRDEKESLTAMIARKEEAREASEKLENIRKKRAEVEKKLADREHLDNRVHEAKAARDQFVADSRVRIGSLNSKLAEATRKAALLSDSRCPFPEQATCAFLTDAVEAKKNLQAIQAQLDQTKADDRAKYNEADQEIKELAAAADALGNPREELAALGKQEREAAETASISGKIEAAVAKTEGIDRQIRDLEEKREQIAARREEIADQLPALEDAAKAAEAHRRAIRDNKALADTLPACKAAAATAEALGPQVQQLEAEATDLKAKQAAALIASNELLSRLPQGESPLPAMQEQKEKLNTEINDIAGRRGGISAKLKTIAEAEDKIAELREENEAIASKLNDYVTLVQAFGLDGIQHMIIRGIVPEITRRANDILAAMTGGRMAVDIRTETEQRSTKQIVNSLEVWITSLSGDARPYNSHSGGEKVKISLAVTLGLADVKARRAGVQLGMLFIDEPPFLDADGTEAYADALTNMAARNPDMRILAISHDPTMKARFQQNITVTAGENGSTVAME